MEKSFKLCLLILGFCLAQSVFAQSLQEIEFPATFEAKTNLNVRESPNRHSRRIGMLTEYDRVEILGIEGYSGSEWGELVLDGDRHGYVYMAYMQQVCEPVQEAEQLVEVSEQRSSLTDSLWTFWKKALKVFRYILIGLIVLLIFALKDIIISIIGMYVVFAIIGAIIGFICGNASMGVSIACWILTIVGGIYVISNYGGWIKMLLVGVVLLPLIPLYVSNQLQWMLIAPWRWFFKSDWADEDTKSVLRPICTLLSVVITIVATPLRLLNSLAYNSIHLVYDFYNYLLEVFFPSADDEGGEDVWTWIVHLFTRIVKYPIFHGAHSVFDAIMGVLIDIVYPSVTMYHGTSETAADNILADNDRNSYQQWHTDFLRGTFKASSDHNCTWAGMGVYFAKSIFLAISYASCGRNSDGSDFILIASRISYGRIISYNLAPYSVSSNTGRYGNHAQINNWSMNQGYTTGEWWNGANWEYCLFDWQNRYNHPWRIRPIYAFNLTTLFFHRIKGGMQHWQINF